MTLTGTGFPTVTGDLTILIDTYPCTVQSANATQITCTTTARTELKSVNTFTILMANSKSGFVSMQTNMFYYANLWSDGDTWGGDFPPRKGDSIQIPKGKTLLFDLDYSPILNLVTVEGQLIFLPDADATHQREFDAHYVFIGDGARMEVGTENHRYTSKMTITMHGHKHLVELPIYGNKGIFVRRGTIDMHGVERTKTWALMEETSSSTTNQNQITLRDPVDWKVGEVIVIASTSFNGDEAEERVIKTITSADSKPVITFVKPLEFKHFAKTLTYPVNGTTHSVEMRAEVGLLTRNVVF